MAKTPAFITELRLKVNREQERRLLVRLEAVRQVYNACLGESLERLTLMRESREYQAVRNLLYLANVNIIKKWTRPIVSWPFVSRIGFPYEPGCQFIILEWCRLHKLLHAI